LVVKVVTLDTCLFLLVSFVAALFSAQAVQQGQQIQSPPAQITLGVEAAGKLPGFGDADLAPYFAGQMARAAVSGWKFEPTRRDSNSGPNRVAWRFTPHLRAASSGGRLRDVSIQATLYLHGEYRRAVCAEPVIRGGRQDPDLAAVILELCRSLLTGVGNTCSPAQPPKPSASCGTMQSKPSAQQIFDPKPGASISFLNDAVTGTTSSPSYSQVRATQTSVCGSTTVPNQPDGGTSEGQQPGSSPGQETSSGAHSHGVLVLRQAVSTKSFLEKHGVTFNGFLQFDSSTVARGGQPRAIPYDGQYLLDMAVTVDTNKLLGWPGGTLFVDAQSHSGPNILTHQMPSIQDPDNMDASSFTSVDRVWYRQDLLQQKVQLQGGLMYVDDQFFTVPYGQNFVSLDFSSDSSISTFVLPTYPNGSPGGDVFVYPVKGLYFSAGAFNDHSTELPYDPGGNLYITEEGWQGSWHERPYKLQIGSWRDTGRFRRFTGGVMHNHASGVYLVASDKLWQPKRSSDRGLGMFFQFGAGPPAVAAVKRHYGAGLVWTGPFAARPHDEIGVAFSDSILTTLNGFSHGFENEIEAYYQIHVVHGFTIQPDLEYWQHPGGQSTPNTVLVLVRMQYSF
jgi:porin